MKKTLVLFLILSPLLAWAEGWLSSGSVTNPTANQVMVDTGALAGPTTIEFCAYVGSTVGTAVRIQHMNAANTTALQDQLMPVPANQFTFMCLPHAISIADQERVRVIMNGAATGVVSVSLIF